MTADEPSAGPKGGARRRITYQDLARRLDHPGVLRRVLNLWPPLLFAGIRVTELGADYRTARVVLRKHRITSNYVGVQYGGSLFSMVDPFWMIMLSNNLGPDYVVWDVAAQIDYVSPGRRDVHARFDLGAEVLDEVRAAAADGSKVLRWFSNDLRDCDGVLVARVRKQVYVRRKR